MIILLLNFRHILALHWSKRCSPFQHSFKYLKISANKIIEGQLTFQL
jgi:hypothetical protein